MTYQSKYLGFYDECDILDLLKFARKHGADKVEVRSSDWGVETFKIDDIDGVIELLDGADMDWAFRFEKGADYLGTFYIVLGNDDGSAVYDSSCQKWCDAIWEEIA